MSSLVDLGAPVVFTDAKPQTTITSAQRWVLLATVLGSIIEWYDFFIYATAAALVFGKLFFPTFDATAGTLASFGTFAVGMFARPVGAFIFGHFGDRVGRKSMLMFTMLMMGLPTIAIGLIPTYESIGYVPPPTGHRARRRVERRHPDGGRTCAERPEVVFRLHAADRFPGRIAARHGGLRPGEPLISAQFPAEVRYSGISLGVQVAGAIGGGLAPIVAASFLAGTGGTFAIGLYLGASGLVSATCALLMRQVVGGQASIEDR